MYVIYGYKQRLELACVAAEREGFYHTSAAMKQMLGDLRLSAEKADIFEIEFCSSRTLNNASTQLDV